MGQLLVFVSYAQSDSREFAGRLRAGLRRMTPPVEPWMDVDHPRGYPFPQALVDAIDSCDVLLFVVTRESVGSRWCLAELGYAQQIGKRVLPLKLHGDTGPLLQLQYLPPIDFRKGWDGGWEELRQALEAIDSPEARLQSLEEQRRAFVREAANTEGATRERYERKVVELKAKIEEERRRADDLENSRQQVTEEIRLGQARERVSDIAPVKWSGIRFVNDVPRLLPDQFFDRAPETQRLEEQLRHLSTRLVAVVGPAGIGKTAMVSRLLDSVRRDPERLPVDAFVYLPADGSRPIGPAILLEDLCKLVPDQVAAARLGDRLNDSTLSSPEKLDEVLDALAGTRVVVVIDNAEDLLDAGRRLRDPELDEVIRALLIRSDHGVKLTLLTREPPDPLIWQFPGSARRLSLDEGLPRADAERFLRNLDSRGNLGLRSAREEHLERAVDLTGGNPRALEMLFSMLESDPEASLPRFLDELEQLPADQDILRHLIGRMVNRLDPIDRRVMQALAVYRRPVLPTAVDHLLEHYLEGFQSESTLQRLVNRRLVRQDGERFYLPRSPDAEQLLGGIPPGSVADRDQDPPPLTRLALLHRAAGYFVETRKARIERLDDLSAQFAEIDLRIRGQEYQLALRIIYDIDHGYLRSWGQSSVVAHWREQLRGRLGDQALELHNLSWLAHARRLQEDLRVAADLLEDALRLAGQLRDTQNRVRLLIELGSVRFENGEVTKAARSYRQALRAARKYRMKLQEAKARDGLLLCHQETGQFRRSLDQYAAALAILEALGGEESEVLRAQLFVNAGSVRCQLGQNDEALDCLRMGLKLARELHEERLEGFLLNAEAQVLIDGHPAQAVEPASEAVVIGARIRHPYLSREANGTLALAQLCAGNLKAASEAADAAARYRQSRRALGAFALQGITACRSGDQEKARHAFQDAHLQAETLHEREPRNFQVLDIHGLVLCGLALCGDRDQLKKAIRAYQNARAVTCAAGVVRQSLRLLDELSLGHGPDDEVADVRRAAAGTLSKRWRPYLRKRK